MNTATGLEARAKRKPVSTIDRLRSRWLVERNRAQVLTLSREQRRFFLKTRTPGPCAGKPDRYYHFLFDLLLPLEKLLAENGDTRFITSGLGPFIPEMRRLYPEVEVLENKHTLGEVPDDWGKHVLIGMNPRCCFVTRAEMNNFARRLADRAGARLAEQRGRVLVIERLPADPYYAQKGQLSSSGAGRRAILNHDELLARVRAVASGHFDVVNLALEGLSLKEQIELFSSAALVVAQHGAALSNLLWTHPSAAVVEISALPRDDHFAILSRIRGLRHRLYRANDHQATIDGAHFEGWLRAANLLG